MKTPTFVGFRLQRYNKFMLWTKQFVKKSNEKALF